MRIPETHLDILRSTQMAHLATIGPDGRPQSTPVWFDFDGTHVIVNSAQGRAKDRHMRANPHVALSILDPENAYRYLEVQGRVVDISTKDGDAVIDALAKRYLGADTYPFRQPGEVRVTYKILPTACSGMG